MKCQIKDCNTTIHSPHLIAGSASTEFLLRENKVVVVDVDIGILKFPLFYANHNTALCYQLKMVRKVYK